MNKHLVVRLPVLIYLFRIYWKRIGFLPGKAYYIFVLIKGKIE